MRKFVAGKIISAVLTAGGWLIAGARLILDLIGYSTAPEDAEVAAGLAEQFAGWLLSLPWWLPWSFAFSMTGCLIFVSWPRHAVSHDATEVKPVAEGGRLAPAISIDAQTGLVRELKELSDDLGNVQILFANIKYKPLADTLVSIFDLAKWQTHLIKVPLESYMHQYFEGIEVLGYNKHLVDTVCFAFRKAGLPSVKLNVQTSGIKQDNPKWRRVQQTIKITIGHH